MGRRFDLPLWCVGTRRLGDRRTGDDDSREEGCSTDDLEAAGHDARLSIGISRHWTIERGVSTPRRGSVLHNELFVHEELEVLQ
jgi:hypothetical protein